VRAKRQAQAEFLADLILDLQIADGSRMTVSLGDYNAFEFNDGYVDVIGTIKGSPVPAGEVLIEVSNDLLDPNLINLYDMVPAEERYSFTFDGNAQSLDHILVNANLFNQVVRMESARVNADFPQIYYGDPSRPERLADHDPHVAVFSWEAPLRGDLDLDGLVDAVDLMHMANYFAGNGSLNPTVLADFNFDGMVDTADLTWLQNKVAGNDPAR